MTAPGYLPDAWPSHSPHALSSLRSGHMNAEKTVQIDADLRGLYEDYVAGAIDRRGFMRRAAALGVAGAAAAALSPLTSAADAAGLAQQAASAASRMPLDVAEWSYMWVNVKRAETARGTFVGGQQMYVEYMIPAQVRHPFPVVLVHGGGGQGTDWMGTPDGRPGWFQYLVQEGFKVYVVDRPGHGRSPLASRSASRLCRSGGGAREHRRPVHAAERESRADAERVSEASHAVARCGERRLARSRSTRRRARRQLRPGRRCGRRPSGRRSDDKAVRLPRARDRDAAARRSPRTSCSRCRRPTCSTRRGVRRVPTCSTESVPRSS